MKKSMQNGKYSKSQQILKTPILHFGIRNCILYRSWPWNEKYVLYVMPFSNSSPALQLGMHTYITTILTNQ